MVIKDIQFSNIIIHCEITAYNCVPEMIFLYQRKYRSHTWNCININQSEASIYSLLRKVSDYSDNLNLV